MYEERVKKLEERQAVIQKRGVALNKEAQGMAVEVRANQVRIVLLKELEEECQKKK